MEVAKGHMCHESGRRLPEWESTRQGWQREEHINTMFKEMTKQKPNSL